MYKIRKGYGCGVKATLLTPAGELCNLRKARYIAANLVLPGGSTMRCEDFTYNEVTNTVYVKLLPTRDLTAVGQYGIFFNVKLEDKTMYSTAVLMFAEVTTSAPVGYQELALSFALTVVDFPSNVSFTGASPKIGDKNTWLVYNDEKNAYIDTGIEVGYANLLSRYDEKFEEFVAPCIQATDAANASAATANTAAAGANSATTKANTAAGKADAAEVRATAVATAAATAGQNANAAATNANEATGEANSATIKANTAADTANAAASGINDVLAVLAHSDCSIEQRVANLEKALISVITGEVVLSRLSIEVLDVWTSNNIVLSGSGAPTRKPSRAGQLYVDKTNSTIYFSTGNSAVADWKH